MRWAALRIGLPVALAGPADQTEALAKRLREQGVTVSRIETVPGNAIIATWQPMPN